MQFKSKIVISQYEATNIGGRFYQHVKANLQHFKSLTKRSVKDCLKELDHPNDLDYRICDIRRKYDPDRLRLRQALARISLSIDYSAWAKKCNRLDRLEKPDAPRSASTGVGDFIKESKTQHRKDLKAAVLAGTKLRLIGKYLNNPAASLVALYSYDVLRSVEISDLELVSQLFNHDGNIVSCIGPDMQSWATQCLRKYEQLFY